MKRFTSLFIVLCMVLMCCALTGCNNPSVYETVTDAINKTSSLDSMDAVMEMKIDMTVQGVSVSLPIKYEMQASQAQSESPKMRIVMTMGTEEYMDMYLEGEWAYITSSGTSFKAKQSDMDSNMDTNSNTDQFLQLLPEDLINDTQFTSNNDGSKTLTVSVDGEQFSDLYNDIIESLSTSVGSIDASVEISDAVVSITIKDGYITKYEMTFKMALEVSGTTAEASASASIVYNNPGQDVTVTAPEGYQNFPSLSQ